MNSPTIKLTNRMLRIIKNAEKEASTSPHKLLRPIHFLLACLKEKEGALGELVLKCTMNEASLRDLVNEFDQKSEKKVTSHNLFSVPISNDVLIVLDQAICYMQNYNQVYLNEGHFLKALIKTKVLEEFISEADTKLILKLATTSRDMVTHLRHYNFPDAISTNIRRVNIDDKNKLIHFVESHFSQEWSETIKNAFLSTTPSIYVAFDNKGDLVGFAGFDIYQNKKCYFGPMGVVKSNRVKGIGYSLLHHCLKDMHDMGYEYAIIGGAGPIEFYEQACQAVVIPTTNF
ncbi:GNAT family N-acetyltransferase [Lysinibacillus xylanilyticus]|uniref:GNAT family N-acetyltransferase n=1 Tax=Lysinibacillus xylanilyticus TaxID=582475 RepID=UPI002B246D20|nr:GNAT family N-acetyltransferase [Lysinibacillus xylanilyticus]MEB2299388.1 GNAT family N-acetyltransferase [Lysinibacillus xylanilyticus]